MSVTHKYNTVHRTVAFLVQDNLLLATMQNISIITSQNISIITSRVCYVVYLVK